MYKVSSKTNNILVKTRRSLQVDIKSQDLSKRSRSRSQSPAQITSPKPTFNHNKKSSTKSSALQGQLNESTKLSQTHEDMINFVQSTWSQVMKEYEESKSQGLGNVVLYAQNTPNKKLQDFKPFDLEEYWGKRLLQNMNIDPSITV